MNNSNSDQTPGQAVNSATDGHDDPNRGPLDRAANAITGGQGGVDAAMADTNYQSGTQSEAGALSAVFDTDDEARIAIEELRSVGIQDSAVSLITQRRGPTTTSNPDGDVVDEEHTNLLRGIFGGGALGAGLGVAALAIPGVGPLVAAGAIAASAIPGAMAIGAAAGAALGIGNEVLKGHGISDDDAAYYGTNMGKGGVVVTVSNPDPGTSRSQIQEILHTNGGHTALRSRTI